MYAMHTQRVYQKVYLNHGFFMNFWNVRFFSSKVKILTILHRNLNFQSNSESLFWFFHSSQSQKFKLSQYTVLKVGTKSIAPDYLLCKYFSYQKWDHKPNRGYICIYVRQKFFLYIYLPIVDSFPKKLDWTLENINPSV